MQHTYFAVAIFWHDETNQKMSPHKQKCTNISKSWVIAEIQAHAISSNIDARHKSHADKIKKRTPTPIPHPFITFGA